ncbi:ferrochelatase [Arthrobacter stackebrandtii]|uniref:coproporphyrin ferrochelatase n=1 Tax=Arthrobacter stackebrandtii TaxID=272161 RepID=A0ABS4YZJ5_9MICC|nr:ferrochelatase [Arthrobacter stackebrandtii]MBP2414218.1 ferrochelatase [Arthrobacter stackebrandtii]PYG98921.1 ferrochelatase [Arthrobacter stackebrandtii]
MTSIVLVEVGEHYYGFGGKSPINEQNQNLLQALRQELAKRGIKTPILWGNRNWAPFLTDVARDFVAETGGNSFLAIDTSAYSSYSSCRQYREDFAQTIETLANEGIPVTFDKIRQYYNHPGFAEAELGCVRRAIEAFAQEVGELDPRRHRLLYVTHSIPQSMQDASERWTAGYRNQHEQLIDWIDGELGSEQPLKSELVYCSRSGAPHVPWLEPDVNDRLEELKAEGIEGVIVVPLGFVSDHMEVKYDLDTEAAQSAAALGMTFLRADSVGTDPAFVAGLVDAALERAAQLRGEAVESPSVTGEPALGPGSGACSISCCLGRQEKSAFPSWPAGADS